MTDPSSLHNWCSCGLYYCHSE